jgi:hypothetical protein
VTWPSPLFSGFPSFQKSLADPLFPFPASAIQLSKARFSQERICPRYQCSPFSSFQPPASTNASSTPLDRLVISHRVAELVLTHPIHCANNIIVSRYYPPVETLASAAAAGTIGLLETPQSQLHFRQFHNHHLPPLETPLNILTLSDRQTGS